MRKITEARLRKIIYEELVEHYAVNEGIWDDVKSGAKKLHAYVAKQFRQVASKWAAAITKALQGFTEIPDEAKKILQVLKQAMAQSGEKFELDEGLQAAQQLGKLGKNALAIVERDFQSSVHDRAAKLESQKEGKYIKAYKILSERKYTEQFRERLNEDFGVSSAIGISLAIMGGLPMLFKGLHKLAVTMGAHGSAELFEKAEHATHAFEKKAVDFMMPFKLAYATYLGLWKLGIKLTPGDQPMNELEIKAEDEGKKALAKAKGLIYKVLLIYFAWQGIAGALKAGASLLGFVEGGATTIKGIELANGAKDIAKIVRAGSGGLAV